MALNKPVPKHPRCTAGRDQKDLEHEPRRMAAGVGRHCRGSCGQDKDVSGLGARPSVSGSTDVDQNPTVGPALLPHQPNELTHATS